MRLLLVAMPLGVLGAVAVGALLFPVLTLPVLVVLVVLA